MQTGSVCLHLLFKRLGGARKAIGMQEVRQPDRSNQNAVRLEPWGEGDLTLLKKLMGDQEMTKHLGGPESDEQMTERPARYLRLAEEGSARAFKIVLEATGEAVGAVVYWEHTWRGEQVYSGNREGNACAQVYLRGTGGKRARFAETKAMVAQDPAA